MGGGLSKDVLATKHVVIIGGGYGGMDLAAKLKELQIPFSLIDPKEYFYHHVAALRGVLESDYLPKIAIDFKKTFEDSFVQGTVASVDFENKKVTLESGESIQYTDLVFAVGSKGPFPGAPAHNKAEDQFEECKSYGKEIEKASKVVIVGGGAVGCEMAGEISDIYPDKSVTLIHSRDFLVTNGFGAKFQSNVQGILSYKGVTVILEDKVSNLGSLEVGKCMAQTVTTEKGQSIEADIVIKCTGLGPNRGLTEKVFTSDQFDEMRRLKVDAMLQIQGMSNVYAIGDCCDTKEEKMAAHAGTHAYTVSNNLVRELQGKEKLPYKPAFTGMLLTIGKTYGAGIMNGYNMPWSAVGLAKGRGPNTLFTWKYWGMMGQKMPC